MKMHKIKELPCLVPGGAGGTVRLESGEYRIMGHPDWRCTFWECKARGKSMSAYAPIQVKLGNKSSVHGIVKCNA